MTITFQIVELLATFTEAYIGYRLIYLLVENKTDIPLKRTLAISVLLTFVIYILNKMQLFSYYTFIFYILFTGISSFLLFKINFLKSFSLVCFYCLCINLLDFLYITTVGFLLNFNDYAEYLTSHHSYSRLLFIFIVKALLIISYLLFVKIRKTIPSFQKNINYFSFLSIAGFCGTIYLIYLTYLSNNTSSFLYWMIFMIFLFFTFLLYSQYRTVKESKHVLAIRNQMMEKSYDALKESYTLNANLYHDFYNNLSVLNNLIETANYDDAQTYIAELITPINQVSNTIYTGNTSIDFILNYKSTEAYQHQIDFSINAEFSSLGHIKDADYLHNFI